jgi:hypothetical protein
MSTRMDRLPTSLLAVLGRFEGQRKERPQSGNRHSLDIFQLNPLGAVSRNGHETDGKGRGPTGFVLLCDQPRINGLPFEFGVNFLGTRQFEHHARNPHITIPNSKIGNGSTRRQPEDVLPFQRLICPVGINLDNAHPCELLINADVHPHVIQGDAGRIGPGFIAGQNDARLGCRRKPSTGNDQPQDRQNPTCPAEQPDPVQMVNVWEHGLERPEQNFWMRRYITPSRLWPATFKLKSFS